MKKTSGPIEYIEQNNAGKTCLILLHGIGSSAKSFAPVFSELSSAFRVIAWNAPGYGSSDPLQDSSPQAIDYANALADFLERLNCNKVYLVGHSLGALIAASLAKIRPDLLKGLLLVSPALGYNTVAGLELNETVKLRLNDFQKLGSKVFAEKRAMRLVFEPGLNVDTVNIVRNAMASVNEIGYVQALNMLSSGQLLVDIPHIKCPTEVVIGKQDIITPISNAEQVYQILGDEFKGNFTVLDKAGHAIYQQSPSEFAKIVSNFIMDVESKIEGN